MNNLISMASYPYSEYSKLQGQKTINLCDLYTVEFGDLTKRITVVYKQIAKTPTVAEWKIYSHN